MARKPRQGGGYSSSWIRPTTRLAIYLRDGLACVYCSNDWSVAGGLTLDHVVSRVEGGSNDPSNLVTSCRRCNNLRQHARRADLFKLDEWSMLQRALRTTEDLQAKVAAHTAVPLGTFRIRARSLHADPPGWLRELRDDAKTLPNDERVRYEQSGETPPELEPEALFPPDPFAGEDPPF